MSAKVQVRNDEQDSSGVEQRTSQFLHIENIIMS
jgi:hypothetical protein